ncbi:MAG: hypothetical protein J07HQW2_02711 [Haloquadratum walsbyi J07HQW2]|uniref:Uncharacterized protein n=1 Tax=Haloquadratum walsbyi J07HQW2 TaxID=1238425 RepID=U1PV14_9EURY|nr:MAG: hypothetical protein J07HQW2_02711 [Haloquadratum walsbyi J07HQW2]
MGQDCWRWECQAPAPSPGLHSYPPSYADSQSWVCLGNSSRPQRTRTRTRTRSSCELCLQQSTVESVIPVESSPVESYSVRIRWLSTGSDSIRLLLGWVAWGGAGRAGRHRRTQQNHSVLAQFLSFKMIACQLKRWIVTSRAGYHTVDCYSGVGFILSYPVLRLKAQVFSLILYNYNSRTVNNKIIEPANASLSRKKDYA